ncbi:hypothetical protein [Actinoplanes aureus]|uniref:Uncharacterized protein n=1 Tax=Actinoplanes aureus TaxID=2792083 RepID=A0A931CIE7_9ACTN|nr:hypothetical protein [Actinoplanes aureus]MBG0569164.1 hypothetical protein [Actinoplanes aureus]
MAATPNSAGVWTAYWCGDYDYLAAILPGLIGAARVFGSRDVLVEATQLAASTVVHRPVADRRRLQSAVAV